MLMIITILTSIGIATIFEKQLGSLIRFMRKLLGKEFIKEFSFDDNGIDQLDIGTIDGINYGKQYHPVFLAHKALDMLPVTQNNNQAFFLIADWLVENLSEKNNYFLQYNYPYKKYGMKSPWISAMAQGRALEVVTQAYKISNDEKYLNATKNIISSLYIDTDSGGATFKTEKEGWWFEEYPSKEITQPRVLNGMMYTIMGLITYVENIKDDRANYLLEQGLLALEKQLPSYDKNGDSYYNALGRITGGDYHPLHIKQLKIIYAFSQNKIFLDYANKWNKFHKQTFVLRLFKKPDKMNIAVFAISTFIAIFVILLINIFLN